MQMDYHVSLLVEPVLSACCNLCQDFSLFIKHFSVVQNMVHFMRKVHLHKLRQFAVNRISQDKHSMNKL